MASLTEPSAGMALLLRMCSALILSVSAVVGMAAARGLLSGEEAARTPTSTRQESPWTTMQACKANVAYCCLWTVHAWSSMEDTEPQAETW